MKKIFLSILMIIFLLAGCRKYSENEAKDYVQETNEDGIATDLSDNPYYMEKIKGYKYSTAERISYTSEVTNATKHARVLLPADYDEDKEYPVLYLLHGWGGSDKTWLNKDADIIIQNLFYLNDVTEMIVVFPNSCVNEKEDVDDMDFLEASKVYDLTEEDLITSLMPYIESHYSVKTGKENTAIAGYSLGGKESLTTAFRHQDVFGYVGAFSAVSPIADEEGHGYEPTLDDLAIDESKGGFKYIMINVGVDDPYIEGTGVIERALDRNNIEYVTYRTAGAHENIVWQNALYNFGQHIFLSE